MSLELSSDFSKKLTLSFQNDKKSYQNDKVSSQSQVNSKSTPNKDKDFQMRRGITWWASQNFPCEQMMTEKWYASWDNPKFYQKNHSHIIFYLAKFSRYDVLDYIITSKDPLIHTKITYDGDVLPLCGAVWNKNTNSEEIIKTIIILLTKYKLQIFATATDTDYSNETIFEALCSDLNPLPPLVKKQVWGWLINLPDKFFPFQEFLNKITEKTFDKLQARLIFMLYKDQFRSENVPLVLSCEDAPFRTSTEADAPHRLSCVDAPHRLSCVDAPHGLSLKYLFRQFMSIKLPKIEYNNFIGIIIRLLFPEEPVPTLEIYLPNFDLQENRKHIIKTIIDNATTFINQEYIDALKKDKSLVENDYKMLSYRILWAILGDCYKVGIINDYILKYLLTNINSNDEFIILWRNRAIVHFLIQSQFNIRTTNPIEKKFISICIKKCIIDKSTKDKIEFSSAFKILLHSKTMPTEADILNFLDDDCESDSVDFVVESHSIDSVESVESVESVDIIIVNITSRIDKVNTKMILLKYLLDQAKQIEKNV